MHLIITIDTEEDMPLWRPESTTTFRNIERLPALHGLLERYHLRPTYLVDWPVLETPRSCSILKGLKDTGNCEIGMHLHSWNTPPVTAEEQSLNATVLNRLPASTQKSKITSLHTLFRENLGISPTSYRAGRYGVSSESLSALHQLGYKVDSSVVPLHDFSSYGAPDFRLFDSEPFWIDFPSGKLLEVPVSSALVKAFGAAFDKTYFKLPDWTHIKGVLHRLKVARLLWLRPTTSTYEEMRDLADHLLKVMEFPVLNIMFHSSELCPGASPYNTTDSQVEAFLLRLTRILDYLTLDHGVTGMTLSEFADYLSKSEKLKCREKIIEF